MVDTNRADGNIKIVYLYYIVLLQNNSTYDIPCGI